MSSNFQLVQSGADQDTAGDLEDDEDDNEEVPKESAGSGTEEAETAEEHEGLSLEVVVS